MLLRQCFKHEEKQSRQGLQQLDAVGGHGSKGKGPPIMVKDGMILKPFQRAQSGKDKSRGEMEADFYSEVSASRDPLKHFIPRFHGIEEAEDDVKYLKLENLTAGMTKPCVLDLKMGQQTYDETASEDKIAFERAKYPPQGEIGFRVVGMRVYRPNSQAEEEFKSTRDWCMDITVDSMQSAIEQYFFDGRSIKYNLVEQLIEKLNQINIVLRDSPKYRMYGSSLLIVYDAMSANTERFDVRMIDFAHVFPIRDGGMDNGYLHGIAFLRKCLKATMSNNTQVAVGGSHGNISSCNGELLKLEDKPRQFNQEVAFYQRAWGLATPNEQGSQESKKNICENEPDTLSQFVPRLIRVNENAKPRELVICDARKLVGSNNANGDVSIMDIKLGKRSYRKDCQNVPESSYFLKYKTFKHALSLGKTEKTWNEIVGLKGGPICLQESKLGKRDYLAFRDCTTTSVELGFRLTALSHGNYNVSQDCSRFIESRIQFIESIERFLSKESRLNIAVATSFTDQLGDLLNAISTSKIFQTYEMVGTSLLLLHCNGKAVIRWIDFSNATPGVCKECNGIEDGIRQIRLTIIELIKKYSN